MGNNKSKNKDLNEGWLMVHNNNVLVSVDEAGGASLKSSRAKAPVTLTLDVIVGEGLWGFIDTFSAPRTPEFAPVSSLALNCSQKLNGKPKPVSTEVLHAFFSALTLKNPQCHDLVSLSICNISLENTLSDVANAVESLPSLREVQLQSNSLQDKDIEKLVMHSLTNKSLKKITISEQAISSEMRGKLTSFVMKTRPDVSFQV